MIDEYTKRLYDMLVKYNRHPHVFTRCILHYEKELKRHNIEFYNNTYINIKNEKVNEIERTRVNREIKEKELRKTLREAKA